MAYGNPILRETCDDIKTENDISQIIKNMYSTMYNASGIGLAAPQIGEKIKLFIIDISHLKDREKNHKIYKEVFINPEIIDETGDLKSRQEGCLSVPGVMIDIFRKPIITIKYYNEKWEQREETFNKMLARVIQHEYDHLYGKLHIDYASPLRKKLIKGKLNDIAKGKIESDFKLKFNL